MSLRMCDDRLCQECDDLNRAASEGRACADQSSRDAKNSSATRPTQATGTLNNNNTVNNNGVIIDEMLCFVQNKIDTLPPMSIGYLCTATFTEHDIGASKRRLFELFADDSCTRMRKRIGLKRSAQNIEDIIRLLQEKGTDTPTFVVPASTSALPVTVLPVASPAAAYHDDDASIETAVKNVLCDASSLIPVREDRPDPGSSRAGRPSPADVTLKRRLSRNDSSSSNSSSSPSSARRPRPSIRQLLRESLAERRGRASSPPLLNASRTSSPLDSSVMSQRQTTQTILISALDVV